MLIIIYEIIFITDNLVIIWLFELKKKYSLLISISNTSLKV